MEDETRRTRHLNIDRVTPAKPRRGTGPLDYMVPWVVELRIVGTTSVIQMKLKESMVIGRGGKGDNPPDIDLERYNGYYLGVSRRHAVVSALNSRVSIRDLNSSNGTFLNGQKLEPNKEYHLRHGDHLSLGKLALQVSFVVTPSSHEKNDTAFTEVEIPHIGSGERVLVVDDDLQVAQTIGAVLQDAGFSVTLADTVAAAITQIHQALPHAVVVELMLPDQSGTELVRYIRTLESGKHLPIMVMGGASGGYQMGQAIEAGADVYLSKPVGVDELVRGFGKILSQMSR